MKKILFVISQGGIGGAQTFLRELESRIDRSRFSYEVLHEKNFFKIRKAIADFKPDTLFLMSSVAGGWGTLAAIGTKARVVYRIGGWSFNDPKPWWRPLMRFVEQLLARWRDIIILNNDHDYQQAIRYGIKPREKLLVIHNGLDVYKMEFLPRDEARTKLDLPADAFVVGTIANPYPAKGLEYLPRHNRYLVKILSDTPNASRFLRAFDVYVSSSVKEGFSWALLEAMAAKVPIVATRVGAAPEMIQDGVNGFLVEPKKPERIADAIFKLMDNDRLRQEFAIQGHQTILHRFDLKKMVRDIEALL
ncbi:MAG: glycosyltransferase [Patescibacteria group bacterium]